MKASRMKDKATIGVCSLRFQFQQQNLFVMREE